MPISQKLFPGRWRRFLIPASMGILFGLAGCIGPDFETPSAPLAEEWRTPDYLRARDKLPVTYDRQPVDQQAWWKTFNDPMLDSLVDQALAQNLDLHMAAMRIVEGRLARRGAIWLFFPAAQINASAVHSEFSTTVKPNVDVNLPPALAQLPKAQKALVTIDPRIDLYQVGLDAVWEVDIWGKNWRNLEASNADMSAMIAGYDDVMVALVAEVAVSYIQLRAFERRLAASREILVLEEKFLAITEERFKKQEAMETDVLLAKTLVGITRSVIPALEGAIQETENSLCLLLGKAPYDLRMELGDAVAIPVPSENMAVGIPADLLRRRPDVRMAESFAHSQCARIGKVKAEVVFPKLNLLGSIGSKTSDFGSLFGKSASVYGLLGGMVSWNILLYPALVDAIRFQDVKFEEALLEYRSTVLVAATEAENAMSAYASSQEQVQIMTDTVATVRRAANLAIGAYDQGKVIVSVPLVALTILQSQQDQELAQRGQAAMNMVAIYKALGGGWETRVGKELIPEEIRERMRARTDWWTMTWDGGPLKTGDLENPEPGPRRDAPAAEPQPEDK